MSGTLSLTETALAAATNRAATAAAVLQGNIQSTASDNELAATGAYTPELPAVPTPPAIAADPALTAAVDFDLEYNYFYWRPFTICDDSCNYGSNLGGLYGEHDFGWGDWHETQSKITGMHDARYTDLHTFGNFSDLGGSYQSSSYWLWTSGHENWFIVYSSDSLRIVPNLLDGSLIRPKTPSSEPFANFNRADLPAAWQQISHSQHHPLPESFQSAAYIWTTFSATNSGADESTKTGTAIYQAFQHANGNEDAFEDDFERRLANMQVKHDFLFAADGDPLDPDSPMAGTGHSALLAQRFRGNEAPASSTGAEGNSPSASQEQQLASGPLHSAPAETLAGGISGSLQAPVQLVDVTFRELWTYDQAVSGTGRTLDPSNPDDLQDLAIEFAFRHHGKRKLSL